MSSLFDASCQARRPQRFPQDLSDLSVVFACAFRKRTSRGAQILKTSGVSTDVPFPVMHIHHLPVSSPTRLISHTYPKCKRVCTRGYFSLLSPSTTSKCKEIPKCWFGISGISSAKFWPNKGVVHLTQPQLRRFRPDFRKVFRKTLQADPVANMEEVPGKKTVPVQNWFQNCFTLSRLL